MRLDNLPLMETFDLKSDPDKMASVTVRQASEGEAIERSQLLSRTRWVDNGMGERAVEQDINYRRLYRREAYLTLGKLTGILVPDKHGNDVELFRHKETPYGPKVSAEMSESEFNFAWDRLSGDMVREIVGYVHEVNPDWSRDSGN